MPPLIAYGAGAVGGIECFADQASLGSASIGVGHALHPQLEREAELTEERHVQQDGEDQLEEEAAGDGPVHHHQLDRDLQETVDAGEYLGQQLLPGDKISQVKRRGEIIITAHLM